jgi:hypothetical protein
LAEILLELCGDEPDFVQRAGHPGSLMDRARRALMQAGERSLPLAEIARAAGGEPAALRRKLRQHCGKWVEEMDGMDPAADAS